MDTSNLWVFRIIHVDNLYSVLNEGLHCKNANRDNGSYVAIGNHEIISERDNRNVKCFCDESVVNDYVPFYFSVRTPMLYNIYTGYGVTKQPQDNIIYLCCKFDDLACSNFQWCFTDGNAAKLITKFYSDNTQLNKLDWRSIQSDDFRTNNDDGDHDRVRKKHAEFLVKSHVPCEYIKRIVVLNQSAEKRVKEILKDKSPKITVHINPKNKFYF